MPAGGLRWNAELPAVGDWVRARRADTTLALIENAERRTTCISRQRPSGGGEQVLAANVELIVIVMVRSPRELSHSKLGFPKQRELRKEDER